MSSRMRYWSSRRRKRNSTRNQLEGSTAGSRRAVTTMKMMILIELL